MQDKLTIKFTKYYSDIDSRFLTILSLYVNDKITSTLKDCKVMQSFELCEICNCYCIIGTTNKRLVCDTCINNAEKEKIDNSGYVYFYGSLYHKIVKIGCSNNPKFRVLSFKNEYPFDTELILTIPTSDKLKLEKYYHRRFLDKRITGEWFGLSERDIEEVKYDTTSPL
jgi:hypothetical protein